MTVVEQLRTGHVGINVTDLDRSLRFYRDVLGFDVVRESTEAHGDKRFAFLARGGRLVLTLWQQAGDGYEPGRAGLHHLSFEVDHVDDVRSLESALRRQGTRFAHDGVVAHDEGASSGGIFFHDPDGVRLEIYAPTGVDDTSAPSAEAPTCGFF
ncbi:VOC family protein [Streptomyces sp. AHA2]|uniref:VOC family protein n=1 Tax=Streptomyces sp. AHA2 TaxID=3064526 RepID=UPI002FE08641